VGIVKEKRGWRTKKKTTGQIFFSLGGQGKSRGRRARDNRTQVKRGRYLVGIFSFLYSIKKKGVESASREEIIVETYCAACGKGRGCRKRPGEISLLLALEEKDTGRGGQGNAKYGRRGEGQYFGGLVLENWGVKKST